MSGLVSLEDHRRYVALVTAQHNGRIQRIATVRPTEAPTWFVAWTAPRIEAKAAAGLKDAGFRVFLPTIAKWTRRGQRPKERLEWPLFPGYVFVGFDPIASPAGYRVMGEADGVCGVLANDGHALRVPAPVMARMQAAQARGDHDATIREAERFAASLPKQGAYVRMRTGIFEGLFAWVTAVKRAHVQLTLAGSSLTVEMPASQAVEGLEPA